MKVLLFLLGVLAMTRGQAVGNNCVADATLCETRYNTALPNDQGSHAVFCQLTDVLVACVEKQAARTDCAANTAEVNRLRKKAQEQLNLHKCVGIQEATKCQADLDACSRTFESAVALAGHDRSGQCAAGAAYITCLQNRDSDPNCKTKTAAIDSLRKKTQEEINTDGCGTNPDTPKLECNDDVQTCETRFKTDVTNSGTNVQMACQAGATLEACFKGREILPDCKGSQSIIDHLRSTYKEQIDQDGCGSTHAMMCVQGVQDCNTQYDAAQAKLTTPALQCTGANALIDCLNQLSCSASYEGQLQKGVDKVTAQVAGGNCKLKSLKGSAHIVKPAIPALFLLVLVVLVV